MKFEEIVERYGGIRYDHIPAPEYVDQFVDDLICCDEFDNQQVGVFSYGYMLGICTVLSYVDDETKRPSDVISRLTQFMLTSQLRQETGDDA